MTRSNRALTRAFLAIHVLLIVVSVVAFMTVVNRPPPAGVDPVFWGKAYRIGMVWTGPLYIVTGFVTALLGFWTSAGARRATVVAGAVIVASLGAELLGTSTGVPFGAYGYGDQLGYKVLGLVPAVIPLSWFFMLYASLGIAARVTTDRRGLVVIGALGLVAWDVLMDPAMSAAFPFWSWHSGGLYYGMPLVNWLGWLLTGLVLAAIAVRLAPEAIVELKDRRLPVGLYLLNGLFPLALALQSRLDLVVLIGGSAMAAFAATPWLLRTRRARASAPLSRPAGRSLSSQ